MPGVWRDDLHSPDAEPWLLICDQCQTGIEPEQTVMPLVRARISVSGFSEAEIRSGIPDLLDELEHRPWIVSPSASWDSGRQRLVVTVHYEGDDIQFLGRAATDEVWDCVIACINFASEGIEFQQDDVVMISTD